MEGICLASPHGSRRAVGPRSRPSPAACSWFVMCHKHTLCLHAPGGGIGRRTCSGAAGGGGGNKCRCGCDTRPRATNTNTTSERQARGERCRLTTSSTAASGVRHRDCSVRLHGCASPVLGTIKTCRMCSNKIPLELLRRDTRLPCEARTTLFWWRVCPHKTIRSLLRLAASGLGRPTATFAPLLMHTFPFHCELSTLRVR
jgi:hypothetical protein